MIVLIDGNMMEQEVDAWVNPVNCMGVVGRGLSRWFQEKWPDNFAAYVEACRRGEVEPGKIMTFRCKTPPPRWIFNFPTRRHWREKAQLADIASGLRHLREIIPGCEISSVAIPALGGGLEGLLWKDVFPLVVDTLRDLPGVSILVPRLP